MNTGGVTSAVQVTEREIVAVLPQASVAVNVLVLVRRQLLLWSAPSTPAFTEGVPPQPSVAVAEPSAAEILVGLQPSA